MMIADATNARSRTRLSASFPVGFGSFMSSRGRAKRISCRQWQMSIGLKRVDLQALAQAKIDDAILLLEKKRFSNAYYLAGYAVELALKACIAKQMAAEVIPDKTFVNSIYNHRLRDLIGTAGLTNELKKAEDTNSNFGASWAIVSEWNPELRYETKDGLSAQLLIAAIMDPQAGVLSWIKKYW